MKRLGSHGKATGARMWQSVLRSRHCHKSHAEMFPHVASFISSHYFSTYAVRENTHRSLWYTFTWTVTGTRVSVLPLMSRLYFGFCKQAMLFSFLKTRWLLEWSDLFFNTNYQRFKCRYTAMHSRKILQEEIQKSFCWGFMALRLEIVYRKVSNIRNQNWVFRKTRDCK